MIDPKVFENNEICIKCGGTFNKHFNLCVKCKNTDNSGQINLNHIKYKAIGYVEGDMNNHHIAVVTVKNHSLGTIRFIVPYNSQIANRVKYYVDNGIRDFLEDGLSQEYLINIEDFTKKVINGEIYLVLKALLTTNEELENHTEKKNKEESISVNSIENDSEKQEYKLNKSTNFEDKIEKWQQDVFDAINEKKMVDMNLFFLRRDGEDKYTRNKRFMENVVSRNDVYLYLNSKGLVNIGFCPIIGEDIDQSYSYTFFDRKIYLSEKGLSICNEIRKNWEKNEYEKRNISSNIPYEKMVQKQENKKSIFRLSSSIISFYLSYQLIDPTGFFSILFFLILGVVSIPIIEFLLIFLYANLKGLIRKK